MHRDGSEATKIVPGVIAHPDVSPDGNYVLYHTTVIGNTYFAVARVSDGQPAIPPVLIASTGRLTGVLSVGRGRWRPDGKALVYVGVDATGASCLYEQAFVPGQDTSATRKILQKSELAMAVESFGISPTASG